MWIVKTFIMVYKHCFIYLLLIYTFSYLQFSLSIPLPAPNTCSPYPHLSSSTLCGCVCARVHAWVSVCACACMSVCVWVCVCAFSNIHPRIQHWIPSSTFLHFAFWNMISHWTQISRNVSANPSSVGPTNMSHSIWPLPLGCWVLWLWS